MLSFMFYSDSDLGAIFYTLYFTVSNYIGTTIKHPYLLQMSGRDDDDEDDAYMGYRYTTCPDCEREIPNEPTKKEFAEMMR